MLIAVAMLVLSTHAFGQRNLRESARELALRDPNGTMNLPASPEHLDATTVEHLARESIVVVTGRLVRKGSYLSRNEDYVRTDYYLTDVVVLRGRLTVRGGSVPGSPTPAIISAWGGEVVVEGVRIRAEDQNFEPIQEGLPYLLFLTPARSPETRGYDIYNAAIFEIESQKVKPLLKRGHQVFAWAADVTLPALISKIQSAGWCC